MSDSQSSQSQSIKQSVLEKLNKNPLLKAKDLCFLLNLPYKKHGDYINHIRSRWKSDLKYGLGSKRPTSQNRVRAVCYAPKSCDRAVALQVGWDLSRNRNKTLCWNKDRFSFGRIEWFTSGKVLVYVKKPHSLIRAKQLLTKAFFDTGLIFDTKTCGAFLDSVHWKGSHDVWDTGERLPYKVIDAYKDSLGFVFKAGDASHPTSYEFEWCHPDILERLELVVQMDTKAIQEFNKFMKDLSQPRQPNSSAKGMVI